ncbi:MULTISPECIES: sensor domain-containing diguanylate cyclase [Bradyrhizobium]|uniref:sensor domain-containing diguanylate cyclase n=1 Tax=Bradyrhizobium TaxID=374 RepID=UPI001B8A7460|nr:MULTISPECIES: diguanylate cyclase [Bradyrhizobium]MBR0969584.1 diguanylate cyclase [Bradyrhizobium japonicum]
MAHIHQSIQRKPQLMVGAFLALMLASVLGLVSWKTSVARNATLVRAEEDLNNLARSLARHATNTFKASDVAMTGMADLLKYQNPLPERFNAHLIATTRTLSQIREIGVLNAEGNWRYSSFERLPEHNNSDRPYFARHRDNPSSKMLVTGPIISRMSGQPSIILSKRITTPSGEFAGVVVAAIDCGYFSSFYSSFGVGTQGGISLLSTDGTMLARWPIVEAGRKFADTSLFQKRLSESSAGAYKITSPFDGLAKYIAYERDPEYQIVVTVARSENEVLANWRADLISDAVVAGVLVAIIIGMAGLLSSQLRFRTALERSLREREARFRLLADNIADIVIVMDRNGVLRYVSPSVVPVLGMTENVFLGRSCLDVVHDDDREKVIAASRELKQARAYSSVRFRVLRGDGAMAWLDAHFKLAEQSFGGELEIVGVLRDITEQKGLEDELSSANLKLAQLATTDGLTRLANRRSFDAFLREAYVKYPVLSVLLIDIDHFKDFNDTLGHQAGDDCLQRVAEVVGSATANTGGLSARYGGEEFAMVLPGVDEERAVKVADALRVLIRRLQVYHPRAPRSYLTISVGVAQKSDATIDERALVRDADIALYHAKEQGRDCTMASSRLVSARLRTPSLVPSLSDLQRTSNDA